MKTVLWKFLKSNAVLLTNASSLVSTTAVTSALGFVYWWLAARQFAPADVGMASASVSAMMLLGSISVLGMGTLLMGELPRQPKQAPSLLATALLVAAAAGGVLGLAFAIVMPRLSAELGPLSASVGNALLFAAGVSMTAVTLILDQALIGLLRGGLQLARNIIFATVKLVALWALGLALAEHFGLTIYATWVAGILMSLLFLGVVAIRRGLPISAYRPRWALLRKVGRAAIEHHFMNIALQIPSLVLPVLVTVLLSATANAHFYAAWMVATFVFVVPIALTTALYAVSAADPDALAQRVRHTLSLSTVSALAANVTLFFIGNPILRLFGATYTNEAGEVLRILLLAAFPLIVRNHYVAISRVYAHVNKAARFTALGGALELILAAAGARLGGLEGLSIGWLCAVTVEAIFMARTVYRAAISAPVVSEPAHNTSHTAVFQSRHGYTKITNTHSTRSVDPDTRQVEKLT